MTTYRIIGRDTGVPSLPDDALVGYSIGDIANLTLDPATEAALITGGLIEVYAPATANISGAVGSRYKVLAGVIRNAGATAYFQPITGGGHAQANIDSMSTTSLIIQLQYPSIGAKNVVTFIAQPDEVYAAAGITLGCSVGLTSTDITVYRQRQFSDRIFYDGSAWQRASGSSNSPFLVASFTSGVLRITHATIGTNNPYGVSVTSGNAAYDCIINGTVNDTEFNLSFVNSSRTVVTTADTNMNVFITRPQFKPEVVSPQTLATSSFPNSNIWIYALFEV
jgi:hypothetical protein